MVHNLRHILINLLNEAYVLCIESNPININKRSTTNMATTFE